MKLFKQKSNIVKEQCNSCGNGINDKEGRFVIENEGTVCGACYDDFCHFCFEDGQEYDPNHVYPFMN